MTRDSAPATRWASRAQYLWLALAASALAPVPARAETAVLLSPRGDDTLAAQRDEAQRVLLKALTGQAVHVLSHDEAVAQASEPAARECDAVDCAATLLQGAAADVAVALAVWAIGEPPHPGTVFVTLVDRRGVRYPGKAQVQGGENADLSRGVTDALLDARALQLLGPGPWLRIRGEPEGAEVVINGKLVGTLPYRAPISSGRHTLEVKSEGHRSFAQTVDVPPSAARQVEVDVALEARSDGAGPAANAATAVDDAALADDGGSSRPIVGPLILGAVGVGIVATDIVLIVTSGCDRHNAFGHCEDGNEVDTGWAIAWAGVGASAIVGAVLWHVLAPASESESLSLRADRSGAGLVISGEL